MILQLLNGDLHLPPANILTVEEARVWLVATDIFPNGNHIVFTNMDNENAKEEEKKEEERYLVVYAQPSLYIPDLFAFPENQYNFSNSSWMGACVNESILTYLAAEERYLPTLLAYPALWRNPHPLIASHVVSLLPDLYSHKIRPNCIDLVWSHIWANSNQDVVDNLLTHYYRDSMCFGLRTMIHNTNPRMVDWCMKYLFEEPDDMPWHLMYTRVTSLLPNATTPETVHNLWEKWKKIPQATSRQLPFNRLSPEYLALFQRDIQESQLYKFVYYESLTDEDLALECVKELGKSVPDKMWSTANCPSEKVISYLLDEVFKNEIDTLSIDHLARNPTERAVDMVLQRMTERSDAFDTDQVLHLLRHNENPRAVQFCKEKLANDGRDLFDIVNRLGEKHYGDGYTALSHITPSLSSWICTQPSFFQRVQAIDDKGLRKKWMWNTIIALSRSTDCHLYFV